jgi:hypothetical protein
MFLPVSPKYVVQMLFDCTRPEMCIQPQYPELSQNAENGNASKSSQPTRIFIFITIIIIIITVMSSNPPLLVSKALSGLSPEPYTLKPAHSVACVLSAPQSPAFI